MNKVKAIVFDFGNVICKFNNNLFIEKISGYTDKSFDEIKALLYKESGLLKLYETGMISSDEFFKKATKLCDLSMSKDKFIEAFTNIFSPISSTFELVKKLNNNYKLALLSNTNEWDFNFGIKPIQIFDLFDSVTLSYEVKAMKPNEKIYEDCLGKLNLDANECVYIDDIRENTDKATELGMFGIHYTSHENLLLSLKVLGIKL